jgi:hypothetical protein
MKRRMSASSSATSTVAANTHPLWAVRRLVAGQPPRSGTWDPPIPTAWMPLASSATDYVAWGPDLSCPSGVVSTCSTDQPLRHRRSRTSTWMPVRCDHPTRVSVSPFQVSSSWRWCRRVGSDRSSLGDRECGKSMDVYIRRRSGSSRSDRSVSRSSARRNSSFESGRWSGGGLRRGRRSSVTSEPPPPPRQVAVGRPTRGSREGVAVQGEVVGLGPSLAALLEAKPADREVAVLFHGLHLPQ